MITIDDITYGLLLLVRAGVLMRVIICFIKLGNADEEFESYKKRLKNCVVFYVLAECIFQIKDIILYYYQ